MLELIYITLFVGVIPAFILFFIKHRIGSIKPLIYLTAISAVYEFVFSLVLKINSATWFILYDILEFLCTYYYFHNFANRKFKNISMLFLLLFFLAQGLQYVFWTESDNSQPISLFVYILFIFIITVLWIYHVFSAMEVKSLWEMPDFYYLSGIFICHSSTFFLFLLSDVIMKFDAEQFMDYWILNIISALLLRIFLITGIWKTLRK